MDCTIIDSQLTQSACFGQSNRGDSSLRRRSLPQLGDDTDSESVSEAGDIGDRALSSKRYSGSGRIHFLDDNVSNNNFALPVQQEVVVHLGSKEQVSFRLNFRLFHCSVYSAMIILGLLDL